MSRGRKKRTSPTPKQIKMCNVMVEHPDWTQKRVAEEIGVSEVSLCKGMKEDYVREELDRQLDIAWKDTRKQAQKRMIDLMNEGSFQATKYVLDSLGYAPDQNVNVKQETITISLVGGEDEDKSE